MHRSIFVLLICGVAVGCKYYDDDFDHEDDGLCDCGEKPPRKSTGGAPSGGNPGGASCGGASGGAGNTGGDSGNPGTGGVTAPPPPAPPAPTPCGREADCAPGTNCDLGRGICTPSDLETCRELTTESGCDERTDCLPVYAGVDCSCGADCQCVGGEPGCICASFEFFRCEPAE